MDEWTDKRLDDRFKAVDEAIARLERAAQNMTDVPARLEDLATDVHESRNGIAELSRKITERNEQRARERVHALEQRELEQKIAKREKKKDRRWFAGIIVTASGVIVAAVGILISVVT